MEASLQRYSFLSYLFQDVNTIFVFPEGENYESAKEYVMNIQKIDEAAFIKEHYSVNYFVSKSKYGKVLLAISILYLWYDRNIGGINYISVKVVTEIRNKIRLYLERRLRRKLDEKELNECYQSMYYLGRAIYRFNKLKQKQ